MTFLEALYGGQYNEIKQRGGNTDSARMNGNLFLMAFVIICLFLMIAIPVTFSESLNDSLTHFLHKMFGYSSGKAIGRLLAIPLMVIIYFVLTLTVGNKSNYQKHIQGFENCSDDEKRNASKKTLVPFFIVLGVLFVLMISSLF